MIPAMRVASALFCASAVCCGLAGCGAEERMAAEVPVPTVPAADSSAGTSGSTTGGLPAGHPPVGTAANSNPSGSGRVGPFEFSFRGLLFDVPAGWKEVELTEMQRGFVDARFLIPSGDSEVQLTFSSVGGGVQANIDRWIGQFQLAEGDEPKIETIEVAGVSATWVDIRGTYSSGFGAAASTNENQRMLGAALPLPTGDVYLKLTGPRDVVANIAEDVRKFVVSARRKE